MSSKICSVEAIIEIQEKYQDIVLNFGKNKGKSLKEIINEKDGPDYLKWIHGEIKKKDAPTPTQRAISKYVSAIYEL